MDKILEQLKSHFSEDELKELKESMEKLVTTKVNEQVAEKEKVLEAAAERMIKEETEKEIEKKSKELKEANLKELEEIEETVVEAMSSCMKKALDESISDEMLHKIALAEMYEPIIAGTQELFENNLVKLSPSANKKVKVLEEKVQELESKLNESIEQNFEHEKDKEILKKAILVESAKLELTTEQANQLDLITESVDLENLEKNIEKYVKHIQESSVVNPKSYLSEKDIKAIQRKRWNGRVEARGDLDESDEKGKSKKSLADKFNHDGKRRLKWKD